MSYPTIWKFPLDLTDRQVVILPKGATPIAVDYQGERLAMWAIVDREAPQESIEVLIFGTGHPMKIQREMRRLGTIQKDGFVWHVFV